MAESVGSRDGFAPDPASSFVDREPEHRFLRGLVLGMRCGILTVDAASRLVLANDPAVQVLELDRVPEAGIPIEAALARHPRLARVLRESFEMSSLPNRAEIELSFDDGRKKTVGFTVSMVADADGSPAGAAVFFKDLTHVEHREEQERLKDRLASLGQMAANLAHEIRNPLASIEVTCSLLRRKLDAADVGREPLDKIIAEVRRLNRTITSSLEFVRPLSLSTAHHPLVPVLEDALRVAEGRSGGAGVRIVRRYETSMPPLLLDRTQLRQVFENLFLNALEAMGDEGELRIETATQPAPDAAQTPYDPGDGSTAANPFHRFTSYAVVRVTDTGPGVATDRLDKLFYPFFTTKKHGSGVGLSMARKIVDSHYGQLDVESEPGNGATFIVRLPMVVRDAEETQQ